MIVSLKKKKFLSPVQTGPWRASRISREEKPQRGSRLYEGAIQRSRFLVFFINTPRLSSFSILQVAWLLLPFIFFRFFFFPFDYRERREETLVNPNARDKRVLRSRKCRQLVRLRRKTRSPMISRLTSISRSKARYLFYFSLLFLISSQFGSDLVDWLGFVALIGSCNVECMMQSR